MYFVTSIDNCNRCSQPWGFFEEKETAIQALNENWGDMHECVYPYAVIERLSPGLYPPPEERVWFQWMPKKNGFYEIETPECANDYTPSYAIAFF